MGAALDIIPLLPGARATHRRATTSLRLTLSGEPHEWLAQAGLPPDLLGLPVARFDRDFIIRIRGAIARAYPQPAEMNLRGAMTTFFRLAVAQGWAKVSPMLDQPSVVGRSSKVVTARERRKKRLDMPDSSQIALLLSDADDWVALADWLTLDASPRPQELRALRWTDVKLHPRRKGKETGGALTILRSMGSGEKGLVPGHLKTDQSQRVVEFGPELAGVLRAAMPPVSRHHYHIVSPDGKPVSARALRTARQERQVRLRIAYWAPTRHSNRVAVGAFDGRKLRHAFAARRIAQGTPHTTLARQMGHKHHRITLNLYGYLLAKVTAARLDHNGNSHHVRTA
jgi:hypothetical protein